MYNRFLQYSLLLAVYFIWLPKQLQAQEGGGCTTPNNAAGTCIGIRNCRSLLTLLSKRGDPQVLQFLRNSRCGGTNSNPLVCCPNTEAVPGDQRVDTSTSTGTAGGSGGHPKFQSPPQCGYSEADRGKILGGNPAELGAWPWIAALGYRSSSRPEVRWLCGAALINDQYVVTAAHCTKHPSLSLYSVRLGDLDLNRTNDGASPVDILVERSVPHPSYSPTKFTDDIALVKLRNPVRFNTLIQPICLPKNPELKNQKFEKYNPFVAGWGSTAFRGPSSTHLMEVQIPVVSNAKCAEAYRPKKADILGKQMCAGFQTGGKDACQGDSGGPMMVPYQSHFYLIGVVSYGFRCGEPGFPGVYSRVTEYLDWIHDNI